MWGIRFATPEHGFVFGDGLWETTDGGQHWISAAYPRGSILSLALVLNLHQPAGNLDDLLRTDPWAAAEILHAIDRIARSLWPYEDTGGVQPSLSGTLLEALTDPGFQRRVYGTVDCGSPQPKQPPKASEGSK